MLSSTAAGGVLRALVDGLLLQQSCSHRSFSARDHHDDDAAPGLVNFAHQTQYQLWHTST
jgi:hypothetical protein